MEHRWVRSPKADVTVGGRAWQVCRMAQVGGEEPCRSEEGLTESGILVGWLG